jgi:hypothetical protein
MAPESPLRETGVSALVVTSRQLDASKNLAKFGVICFNQRIIGGIEACRISQAFSMSMTVYAG